jgi:hypothetical protein
MTSKMQSSYAEGCTSVDEYTTQNMKGVAYTTNGTGDPDYTWQIGGTVGYAVSEADDKTYLEQKMNGEYATGEVDAAEAYAVQGKNGEYIAYSKGDVVAPVAEGGYVVMKKDEEDYVVQDSNGPYTVAQIGDPDYALGSSVLPGYSSTSNGVIYSEGSDQGQAYTSTAGFTTDYVTQSN